MARPIKRLHADAQLVRLVNLLTKSCAYTGCANSLTEQLTDSQGDSVKT